MIETLKAIDQSLFLMINGAHAPLADTFFWLISESWVFIPLWIYFAYVIYKQKNTKVLITALLAVALIIVFSDQSSNLIKKTVKRYRPTHHHVIGEKVHIVNDYRGGQYGFFSSHAANAFGVAFFVFLYFRKLGRRNNFLIFLWPLFVGYSRIYLGVHYPGDILFGALDGCLWGFIFYKLFLKVNETPPLVNA